MNERKNTADAAAYLGLSEVTLKNARSTGKLCHRNAPVYYQIGKRIWYYDEDLESYVQSCRVVPKSSPEAAAV